MPWKIESNHPSCPAERPWGVVKRADGSLEGCHTSEEKAQAQLAALNIAEEERMADKLEARWIPVFRAGEYGVKGTWTEADIDQIIKDYDPKIHEAPSVIGHPKDDSPAYGWVKGLRRIGNVLEANILPTVKEFVEWVRQGLYKTVSVSIYREMPETGRPYLRHVGFLGGQPPEVKGLPAPAFKEALAFQEADIAQEVLVEEAAGRITRGCELLKDRIWWILNDPEKTAKKAEVLAQIESLRALVDSQEFTESKSKKGGAHMTVWEKLKKFFADEGITFQEAEKGESGEGTGAAARAEIKRLTDAGMSLVDISEALGKISEEASRSPGVLAQIRDSEIANPPESLIQALKSITPPNKEEEMSEKFTEAQVKEREKAAADHARAELEQKHAADRHKAEVTAFVEGRKKEGKYLPAWDALGLTQVLIELPTAETVSFGEGKPKQSHYQVIKTFLEGLPKLVTLEEIAKGKGPKEVEQAQEAAAIFTGHEAVFRQLGVTQEQLAEAMKKQAEKGGK